MAARISTKHPQILHIPFNKFVHSPHFSICAHIPNWKLYHLLEDWKYSDTYCEKILFQTYLLIDIFCIIDVAHSPQPFYLTSRCRTLHAGIVNRIPFSVICVPSYFFTVTHSGSSKVFLRVFPP